MTTSENQAQLMADLIAERRKSERLQREREVAVRRLQDTYVLMAIALVSLWFAVWVVAR